MSFEKIEASFPSLVASVRTIKKRDRIAHAYLVYGDNYSLIQEFAMNFIQLVLCNSPQLNGDACGQCYCCVAFQKFNYPYFQIVQPRSKLQQILIDEVNRLNDFLHSPSAHYWKVGLILEADRMNVQAQNAFLKTLEEPWDQTLIILVSQQPAELLSTIRSRCQQLSLRQNRWEYPEKYQESLVKIFRSLQPQSGGFSALEASFIIRQLIRQFHEESEELAKHWLQENTPPLEVADAKVMEEMEAASKAYATSHYRGLLRQLFETIYTWFAQEYLRSFSLPKKVLPHPELLDLYERFYQTLPPIMSPEQLRNSMKLVEEIMSASELNVDFSLLIENFCFQLCQRR